MPICDMMRANYRNLRNLRESEFGCWVLCEIPVMRFSRRLLTGVRFARAPGAVLGAALLSHQAVELNTVSIQPIWPFNHPVKRPCHPARWDSLERATNGLSLLPLLPLLLPAARLSPSRHPWYENAPSFLCPDAGARVKTVHNSHRRR